MQLLQQILLKLYSGRFEGMTKKQSDMARAAILQDTLINPKSSHDRTINKIMAKVPDLERYQAERIVRTEEHEIRNSVREVNYENSDPKGKNLYRWIGPTDKRTTKVCHAITARTRNGVSLERLKKIIREEAAKWNPSFDPRDFTPHYNCRHTFIRFYRG